MMTWRPQLELNWTTWTVLGLCVLAAVVVAVRRPAAPRATFVLVSLGLIALALASAKPAWNWPQEQTIAVMVDLSASTRTATYRDRAALDRRIRELLRDTPYRIQYFADGAHEVDPASGRLADIPSDRTSYVPPAAAAVLLFSDCRFPLPEQSPPTYVCVDIGLDNPPDAAVTNLEIRGKEAVVSLRNSGPPRRLTLDGAARPPPTTLPAGALVIDRPIATGASRISAEISPGDAWPENDALRANVPPPERLERWWVGASIPAGDWRAIDPHALPTDPAEYLAAGIIVLDNVAASDLSEAQQQRLQQYVRDLGGGLLIFGGDRAFAAGEYQGTPLDALSPLASYPPMPTNHWILLADASGSMSEAVAGGTRWKYVSDAIAGALPRLPPDDLASVASFAEALNWWVEGKPAREAAAMSLPPAGAYPHGPTNLQPSLEAIAQSVDGKMPVQLLVLSDFDTQITGAPRLAELLKSKQVHLHLLAIGEGSALPALRQVATATGGSVLVQFDPVRWAAAARKLTRTAGSDLLRRNTVGVAFSGQGLVDQPTDLWNRVWLKAAATQLARATDRGQTVPMAAQWNVGGGRVSAAAFAPGPRAAETLATRVSQPPRDPRFHITWENGSMLRIVADAIDRGQYLNGQELRLDLSGSSFLVPQTAPGKYELAVESPRSPTIATLQTGGRALDRIAVAGRYAPEFDAIGNDLAAMTELARRSGGAVIPPAQSKPIEIHWPKRNVSLVPELALLAALCIGSGLVAWRRGA